MCGCVDLSWAAGEETGGGRGRGNKENAIELCEEVARILKPSLFDEVVFDEGAGESIKSHAIHFVLS